MTKKDLIVKLALIVSALGETANGQSVPASTIYLALGCDLGQYNTIARVGESVGWLKVTGQTVALTAAGREKAKELQALGV